MINTIDHDWLDKAIKLITEGVTNKIEHPSGKIVAYKVKNIIRVDIKYVQTED